VPRRCRSNARVAALATLLLCVALPTAALADPFPQYLCSGTYHSCALLTKSSDSSKVVKCWGHGSEGQMGNGATANIGHTGGADVVIPEVDLASSDGATIESVHCGGRFTCVVFSNSRLKCFGYGTQYSLGYRTATNTASDETIGDGFAGHKDLNIIKTDEMGTALGYVPLGVDKNGAEHEVAGICIGNGACVMTKETGPTKTGWGKSKFICWSKSNAHGQYGPTDAPQRSMYQGQGGVSGQDRVTAPLWEMDFGNDADNVTPLTVKKCSQTQAHTCVILSNGDLRCFGANWDGQLGLGISDPNAQIGLLASDFTDADKVVDLGDTEGNGTGTKYTAKEVYAGIGGGTCAIRSDDKVVCWGRNYAGTHGLNAGEKWNGGTTNKRGLGTSDMGNNLVISQLGVGGSTSYTAAKFGISFGADVNTQAMAVCVIMTDGTAKCLGTTWLVGQNLAGGARYGTVIGQMASLDPIDFGGDTIEFITIGYEFACAIMSDLETIRCWGRNRFGELGYGTTESWGVHPTTNPMASLPAKVLVGSGYKSATPGPCVASGVITNGAASPCTSSLAVGASCTPTCNSGYTLSGTRSCSAGTLTDTAACTANACVASSTSSKDGSDGTFYCINGGTIGGTAGSCTCTTCNAGYGGTSCQTLGACGASIDSSDDGSDGSFYCINGGTIGGTTGSCTCTTCNAGYSGTSCQTADACTASSTSSKDGSDGTFHCINGGTVGNTTGSCTCTSCNVGYSGTSCQTADACTASPTSSDDGSDGNFHCINGGTVGNTTGSCTCTTCNAGYSGTSCQTASPTPPPPAEDDAEVTLPPPVAPPPPPARQVACFSYVCVDSSAPTRDARAFVFALVFLALTL
jgi:alpha-tubulin suppressor-like RCC1 family protein